MQALRMAIRALRATPVVSLVVIATLGLGIGANTAIFTVVNSLLLQNAAGSGTGPPGDCLVGLRAGTRLQGGRRLELPDVEAAADDAAAFRRRAPVVAADFQLRAGWREGAGPGTARERELLQHARDPGACRSSPDRRRRHQGRREGRTGCRHQPPAVARALRRIAGNDRRQPDARRCSFHDHWRDAAGVSGNRSRPGVRCCGASRNRAVDTRTAKFYRRATKLHVRAAREAEDRPIARRRHGRASIESSPLCSGSHRIEWRMCCRRFSGSPSSPCPRQPARPTSHGYASSTSGPS